MVVDDSGNTNEWARFMERMRKERDAMTPAEKEAEHQDQPYKERTPDQYRRMRMTEYRRLLRELESQKQRDVISERVYAQRKADYSRELDRLKKKQSYDEYNKG